MSDLHLIITETGGYGWTVESPQLPELIGGRNTSTELAADLVEIVEWAKEPDVTFDRTFIHEQHVVGDPDGNEFVIRFLANGTTADYEARHLTGMRLNHAVLNGLLTADDYARHPTVATTGERLYVCARGEDTLGWVQDQLLEREVCCVLADLLGDDGAVINIPYGRTGVLPNGVNIEALGVTRESTFDELQAAVIGHEIDSIRRSRADRSAVTEFKDRLLTPL
ncbi:hypothetical protein ABVN64_30360 [Mycolicibacterium conceptionense]|uniref:hypothetical protein n=1 Tax=Mycolicibacterium TaxID=1866885 RepID=UPI00148F49A5|nr:hypothetical protein [Mycolicibacterium fortuitum]